MKTGGAKDFKIGNIITLKTWNSEKFWKVLKIKKKKER